MRAGPAALLPLLILLLTVPPATGKQPRVLMTGDSMMEAVATQGKQRLQEKRREARVLADVHSASGISKPWRRSWLDYAPFQVRRDRPRATVVMIGANDGFSMLDDRGREVACCRRAWVDAYARAAGEMMEAYTAGGRRLYWLTLPAPEAESRHIIHAAVNAALERAARRHDRVRLLDMVKLFTPGYRYRRKLRVGGRRVAVRDRDGLHLNARGGALAVRAIRRALAADGVIR